METAAQLILDRQADAVPRARRLVRSSLRDWPDQVRADTELVVSELVTNALLHGEAPVTIRVSVGATVRVEVTDAGRSAPILLQRNTDAMTGRGLAMVAALASGWGVEPVPGGGKTVWAELPRRPGQDVPAAVTGSAPDDRPAPPAPAGPEAVYTVRLGAVDTGMLVAAKSHIDNVVRELVLVREGQAASGQALAPEMARLVDTVTRDFADARAEIKKQAAAAAARGDSVTHLELHLPIGAAPAGERYLAALEEADRYARSARLLSLAPPRLHTVFRRWYVRSLVAQLRALARGEEAPAVEPFRDVVAAEMERIPELLGVSSRLELLQKVNAALLAADSPEDMAAAVVKNAGEFLGVMAARVYLLSDQGTLRSVAWYGPALPDPDYDHEFLPDSELPAAEAVRTGRPVILRTVREIHERFPEMAGARLGDRSLHAVPLVAGGEMFGAMSLSFRSGDLPEKAQADFVESLAAVLASALQRCRLAVSDEEARRALAFLADATQIMVTARHPSEVVERLADHAVPELGDWFSVYLADGQVLRRVATALDGFPAGAALLGEAPPISLDLDVPHTRAFRTGVPQLIGDGVGWLMERLYPGLDFAAIGGDRDQGSGLCVPIQVRGRRIGVIALTFVGSGRQLTPRVVETVTQLGARAAIALDHAQSWDAQQRVVQSLVGALLPSEPPRVPGLQFAARYLPAGGDVAGDWWEADLMPDGTVLVGLGDAAGHGVDAVSQMLELRHGARALAAVEASPSALLADLNRRLSATDAGFATAFYSRLDPATGVLRWASAGHVPPLVAGPDGVVTVLNRRGGAPLGTPDVPPGPDSPLALQAGDTLVIYSDGVIERRDEDLDVGVGRLRGTVAAHAGEPLDRLADAIVAGHCMARVDDCCLLLVRRSADPAARPD